MSTLKLSPNETVVCVSGGQDSTTCLAWALQGFSKVYALNFDYGQRHPLERLAAVRICREAGVPLAEFPVPSLSLIGGGGLTSAEIPIMEKHPQFGDLPGSFVPLRNLILFSTAAAYAINLGAGSLTVGVCQTDYSGYPDCRAVFIKQLEIAIDKALDLPALETQFQIHTPLMHLTKAQTVQMMVDMDMLRLLKWSHTCYNNEYPPCGKCPACELRAKGFAEAGYIDPLFWGKDDV
ncbi:MAG: 7-cyano-7-deazaguanine synthase QueC [bacterium]